MWIECPDCHHQQEYHPSADQDRKRPLCSKNKGGCGEKRALKYWIVISNPKIIKTKVIRKKTSDLKTKILALLNIKPESVQSLCIQLGENYYKMYRTCKALLGDRKIAIEMKSSCIMYRLPLPGDLAPVKKIKGEKIGPGRLHNLKWKTQLIYTPVNFKYTTTRAVHNWPRPKYIIKIPGTFWEIDIFLYVVILGYMNHVFVNSITDAKAFMANLKKDAISISTQYLHSQGFKYSDEFQLCGKEELAYKISSQLSQQNTTIIHENGMELKNDESEGESEAEATVETWEKVFDAVANMSALNKRSGILATENAALKAQITQINARLDGAIVASATSSKLAALEGQLMSAKTDLSEMRLDQMSMTEKLDQIQIDQNRMTNILSIYNDKIKKIEENALKTGEN